MIAQDAAREQDVPAARHRDQREGAEAGAPLGTLTLPSEGQGEHERGRDRSEIDADPVQIDDRVHLTRLPRQRLCLVRANRQ
jgi:hypothetical protein